MPLEVESEWSTGLGHSYNYLDMVEAQCPGEMFRIHFLLLQVGI